MFDWLRKRLGKQPKRQARLWIHRGDYVDTIEPDGRYLVRVFRNGPPGDLEIHSAEEVLELFSSAWLKDGPQIQVIGQVRDPEVAP